MPQHTAFEQSAACLSVSWFDAICNIVTQWVNFRKKHLHEHELQLSGYNIYKYLRPNVQISARKIYIQFFAYELFKVKTKKIVNNTRNTYIWVKILLNNII